MKSLFGHSESRELLKKLDDRHDQGLQLTLSQVWNSVTFFSYIFSVHFQHRENEGMKMYTCICIYIYYYPLLSLSIFKNKKAW